MPEQLSDLSFRLLIWWRRWTSWSWVWAAAKARERLDRCQRRDPEGFAIVRRYHEVTCLEALGVCWDEIEDALYHGVLDRRYPPHKGLPNHRALEVYAWLFGFTDPTRAALRISGYWDRALDYLRKYVYAERDEHLKCPRSVWGAAWLVAAHRDAGSPDLAHELAEEYKHHLSEIATRRPPSYDRGEDGPLPTGGGGFDG